LKKELFGPALQKALKHDSAECFTSLNWELISSDKVEKLGELDLKTYLPGDILVKADISSMANALELRSPFMDTAVVEFAARLPMKYKLHGKERKKILKMAFPEFITPELSNRPKRGFGVPVAAWLRESWKAPAEEKLFSSRLISEKFVNENVLKHLWDLHQSGTADYSYLLWDLIVLDLFLERRAAE
jgi:asparagine synthase (glutamine-hydrolysing)